VWPSTAAVGADGVLSVGGVSVGALAAAFGTPVYVLDES
jgi:diaminopimelate decarboxylase